jgi:hypothetical protein
VEVVSVIVVMEVVGGRSGDGSGGSMGGGNSVRGSMGGGNSVRNVRGSVPLLMLDDQQL